MSADQIVQIVGALLILAGFILSQGNVLDAESYLYLILNLAVGGDFPGPIDASTPFPARMLVDYVRVYK